jgi:hypothetical protein
VTTTARIFVALLTAGVLTFLLSLVRRRRLRAKYALLWLATGLVMVVLTVVPGLLDALSRALGIDYGPTTLFTGAIILLLLVCMHFSWELSRLEERARSLAEELALRTLSDGTARRADPPAGGQDAAERR